MTPSSHPAEESVADARESPAASSCVPTGWLEELAARDWQALGDKLTREGCVLIPELLNEESCKTLAGMFDNDALFAKTVVMDQDDFGRGAYRYFQPPLPPLVDALRRSLYPYAARVANTWQELLGRKRRYPEVWEDF